MKNRLGVVVLALALFNAPAVHAQTWTGATNNNWSNGSNWLGGTSPGAGGPGVTVDFGPAPTTISFNPNLDLSTVAVEVMNVTGAGFTFGGFGTLSFESLGAAFLTVSQPGVTFASRLSFNANTTLDNTHAVTFSGGMTGVGTLTKTGAGTLIVSNSPWHDGATTVLAGTLQVGDGLNGPNVIQTPIAVASSLVFADQGVGVSVGQGITGGGSVVVEAGASVFNGGPFAFSHQGSTTVHGDLDAFTGSLNTNGPVLVSSTGTLSLSANATAGSIAGSGRLNVFFGALTAGGDDSSTTFSGQIGGNGSFRKIGSGTFTLATIFNFGGLITVEAPGTLRMGNGSTGPNGNSPQGFVANGSLVFDTNTFYGLAGGISGTGTVRIESGTNVNHSGPAPIAHQGSTTVIGSLNSGVVPSIDNNAPLILGPLAGVQIRTSTVGSLSGSGNLFVSAGDILTAGGDDTSTTYSGNLFSGSGDFRKVGAGTMTLATNTWFGGDVTVEAPGTLRIGNGATGPPTVNSLFVNGALVFDTPGVNLNGTLTGTGSIRVEAGKAVFNSFGQPLSHQGATTVNGTLNASGGPGLSIDNNSLLTIGPSGVFVTDSGQVGSLSGSGLLTVSSGIFTVGGDNTSTTFSGPINGAGGFNKVGAGTLTISSTSFFGGVVALQAPGALRLGNGTTGPPGVPGMVVDGSLFFNTPSIAVNGPINGGGSVTVQSGSAVTLTNTLSYTGATIISGQMDAPGFAAIDNNAPLTLSGGLLTRGGNVGSISGGGNLSLVAGGTFTVGGNNLDTTFAGPVSGGGSLGKVGNGTLMLSGNSPGFSGGVTVSTGTLHVSGTLATGGILVVTGASMTGTGSVGGPVNVEIGGNLSPGPTIAALSTGGLTLAGNLNLQIQGTVPGTQHDRVNVTGPVNLNGGTLLLSGSYVPLTGDTLILIDNDGADPVAGTFAGLPEGATLSFNGKTLRISYVGGSGNDVVLSVAGFTVTPSAGANGRISPNTPQAVAPGGSVVFTVTPSAGYTASVGGNCGGTLVGTTFTTSPVSTDCTVVASFTLTTHTVTPSAGPNGTISPNSPQPVAPGNTTTFTVTPNTGFTAAVGGTCGGTLVGNTYTTNAIGADCTVIATFTATNYTVTPSAGANGSISPATPQSVGHGSTFSFTVTPAPGYLPTVSGTCGGTLAATTYVTNPITADCTVAATFSPTSAPRLVNISSRMRVEVGADVMIGGFVIGGSAPKTVIVRARGPSLVPQGLPDALPNPQLQLFAGATQIGFNDNWQDAANAAQVLASGFAPDDPLEAAILVTLDPGAYTAIVTGVGGGTGIGIVEVFEVSAPNTPLTNISTRGRVGVGDQVIIAGLIVQGTAPKQLVLRARGPSLTAFGVPGVLANPAMALVRSSDRAVIGANDNWGDASNAAALSASGFAPSDPNEAALLVTLAPGAYTVIVNGVAETTGVAIVEVFAVP